ncbi:MAG: uracil-DNA glycosylase [Gammaproteobacteria bacterium]
MPDDRSALHRHYLQAMGIQRWVPREFKEESVAPEVDQEPLATGTDWATLEHQVPACTRCELHSSRTQTVFGAGNRNADWLIIGEAPGKDEDQQGEPFVGRAGQLLNAMLKAIGLERNKVFIANIIKCSPPNNRDPKPDEVESCEAYLSQQISLVNPKLIVTVGRIASQNLLKTEMPIGKLRGKSHTYGKEDIPVIATYHPAYLLDAPQDKCKAWEDLQLARNTLDKME